MRPDRYFVRLDARKSGPKVGYQVGGILVEAPGAVCALHDLIYPAQAERRFLAFMGIALAIVACTVSFAAVMLYTALRYGIGGR